MPSLDSLGLSVNPSTEPARYPGTLVEADCLLTPEWLYPLRVRRACPVGAWLVGIDGGRLAEVLHLPANELELDSVLGQLGEAAIKDRQPVLAVGSNASPGQLRHKFHTGRGASGIVPLTVAKVRGLDVGHAAHISRPGYLPYAPRVGDPSATRNLVVLWLDQAQLKVMHETERNYEPTTMSGSSFPAVLESGDVLGTYMLYRSRTGLLTDPSGEPIRATTQEEAFQLLARSHWFRQLVPEHAEGVTIAAAALARDERRRAQLREAFVREQLVFPDGLQSRTSMT